MRPLDLAPSHIPAAWFRMVAPLLVLLATGAASGPNHVAAASPPAPQAGQPSDPAAGAIQALIDSGRYDEAVAAARARLAAVEAVAGSESPEVARAIAPVLKAGSWSSRPKDPALLDLARRAVAIDEKRTGPNSPETAESLLGLANILIARGEEDDVQGLCERALAIHEGASGPESAAAASAHRCLGRTGEDRGDLHGALVEDARALEIQEKILGREHPEVAATLNALASVQRQLGDYAHALESRQRCLAIRETAFGPDHPQVAWALHNLANLHADLGEYAQARDLYARALAIRERIEPPDHPDLGYSHNSLGLMAYNVGDYAAARAEYEKALVIREKGLGPDHALVAATLNNRGILLDQMGELEAARDDLTRALDIKTRRLGPEHTSTMVTAGNLANILSELGAYERAEELYRRALAADEKELGPDHDQVGRLLDDLGWLRHLRGDDAGAVPLLERAAAIREKALGGGHPDVAETLERLAIVRLESGNATAALPPARRALEIQEATLGPDHPTVAATLALVGSIRLRLGDAAGAMSAALQSESIGREHFRITARQLSQREALRYQQARVPGLDVVLQVIDRAPGDPAVAAQADAALDNVIHARALVLDAIASRRRQAAEARTEEAARRITALNDAASALARLVRREPDPDHPERYLAEIRAARDAEERAERELVAVSPTEQRWSESGRVGLAEVRAALAPGATLLSYVRYTPPAYSGDGTPAAAAAAAEAGYLAFVTTGAADATRVFSLGPASRIDALVARWREEAERGAQAPTVSLGRLERGYRDAALALRQSIWDPVAPSLARSTIVFVVPDGALDVVNLSTLPTDTNRYLIETGPTLHYLSAERDLIAAARERPSGTGLLVVGGADYGPAPAGASASGTCSPFRSLRFAPLPAARDEADAVSRIWARHAGAGATKAGAASGNAGITRLSGTQARASAFLAAAPDKEILHIATHGFFLEDACAAASTTAAPTDPMLLSGLAFAGANQRRDGTPVVDDGLLTAEEIASLDLSRVGWAVLSACDTGLGEVRGGEGVLGLRRAFEIAGAGTLIMSLWMVRDEDATEWMRALYEARFDGLDTSRAMAEAGMRMIAARRKDGRSTHPSAWGAFVAYGAWR
jgi:tetratricopeptide (TPR) repeat protein